MNQKTTKNDGDGKNKSLENKSGVQFIFAKSDDGNIQITFTIPKNIIEDKKAEALKHLAQDTQLPGFRKGYAPLSKIEEVTPVEKLNEHILNLILPKALGEAINKYKFTPAIYPKFEIIAVESGKDWQLRALTCELPKIILNDYKSKILEASKVNKIWTPKDGGKPDQENKELSQNQKEELVIKTLITNSQATIPSMLIDEEVNSRLSKLLEQTEKLGITFEKYLQSIGKTLETLREEYKSQAKDSIILELTLNEIANKESIDISDSEVDAAVSASSADTNLAEKLNTPEQRSYIKSILRRRKAYSQLVALI